MPLDGPLPATSASVDAVACDCLGAPDPVSGALQSDGPPTLTRRIAMCVRIKGGIDDLSRAVGVFALYCLTPGRLAVEAGEGGGLLVLARLEGDPLTLQRSEGRMRSLACVTSVRVRDIGAARAGMARRPSSAPAPRLSIISADSPQTLAPPQRTPDASGPVHLQRRPRSGGSSSDI